MTVRLVTHKTCLQVHLPAPFQLLVRDHGGNDVPSPRQVVIIDINGDGLPDVLTANQGTSEADDDWEGFSLLLNDADWPN